MLPAARQVARAPEVWHLKSEIVQYQLGDLGRLCWRGCWRSVARGDPVVAAAVTAPRAPRRARARRGSRSGATAGRATGDHRRCRGAAPVFADHPRRRRVGVSPPAGAGRHHRSGDPCECRQVIWIWPRRRPGTTASRQRTPRERGAAPLRGSGEKRRRRRRRLRRRSSSRLRRPKPG